MAKAEYRKTRLGAAVKARQDRLASSIFSVMGERARSIVKKVKRNYASLVEAKKLQKAAPAIDELVQHMLDDLGIEDASQDMVDEMTAEMMGIYEQAAQEGLAQVKLEPTDEITNHLDIKAKEYAEERGAELVGKKMVDGVLVDNPDADWSIAETTREELRGTVVDAVEGGWSVDKLEDAILNSGAFSEPRALMLARTELAFAHVAGNVAGWRESGQVTGKRSLLGDLHDHEDECDDNANEGVIPFDATFSSGDDFPPYHPNCICDVEPVLAEDEPSPDNQPNEE